MNNDAVINRLAYITGASRKQVMDVLKKMSGIPEVRKELDRMKKDGKINGKAMAEP